MAERQRKLPEIRTGKIPGGIHKPHRMNGGASMTNTTLKEYACPDR